MNLQNIATHAIIDYLRKERNLIVETWHRDDFQPLFQEAGFEPTDAQLNDFASYVNSNHNAEVGYCWEVLREFVTLYTEEQLYNCQIRWKEDGAEIEEQQFMGMNTNENMGDYLNYTLDEQIFFYMPKKQAQKLVGVEDNGLDFIILNVE